MERTLQMLELWTMSVLVWNLENLLIMLVLIIFIKEDGSLSYINYNDVITGKDSAVKKIPLYDKLK